jgi:hypothetical protein
MNDSIICFTLGLSPQDIEAGTAAFDAVDQSGTKQEGRWGRPLVFQFHSYDFCSKYRSCRANLG